jgi:hypothetical protein
MFRIHLKYYSRRLQPTLLKWSRSRWKLPAPAVVKKEVLLRYRIPDAGWIETGTYLGETSSFLARNSKNHQVFSLEPSLELFRFATKKWRKISNLTIVNESSETGFENTLKKIKGNVNFWLDGHNSGDITYLGEQFSPIELELTLIEKYIANFPETSVFVDDVRLFVGIDGYPKIGEIVRWAESIGLNWKVEHDIFIASTSFSSK